MKLRNFHHLTAIAVTCLFSAALLFLPDPPSMNRGDFEVCRAKVLDVDNQDVALHGLLKCGSQRLDVELLSGRHKGKKFRANNQLRAQMELDKEFRKGDIITLNVPGGDFPADTVLAARDHSRSFWIWALGGIFCLFLLLFASWTGVKAVLSFVFSFIVIWKAVIPAVLAGWTPEAVIAGATALLTFAIIFLVAGFNRKGAAAFCGSMAGVLTGLLLSYLFTRLIRINGAVMPYCQALYYSGYEFLDLQRLFSGTLILGASGAVMDLAMDIAAGTEEIVRHNPGLSRKQLIASGMRIGRSVVGTMTTTLLLAYSAGFLTLLMMFRVEGHSLTAILDNPLVASEAVKTLIGSFCLVLTAPFTALIAGNIFCAKESFNGNTEDFQPPAA
ncbi:MAG: YibE/F family protein [Lentisphaerae bacterium]|nr:YibE/F family protein [Lentisphaerota bacterium]